MHWIPPIDLSDSIFVVRLTPASLMLGNADDMEIQLCCLSAAGEAKVGKSRQTKAMPGIAPMPDALNPHNLLIRRLNSGAVER
jgi:hypothetical protein